MDQRQTPLERRSPHGQHSPVALSRPSQPKAQTFSYHSVAVPRPGKPSPGSTGVPDFLGSGRGVVSAPRGVGGLNRRWQPHHAPAGRNSRTPVWGILSGMDGAQKVGPTTTVDSTRGFGSWNSKIEILVASVGQSGHGFLTVPERWTPPCGRHGSLA